MRRTKNKDVPPVPVEVDPVELMTLARDADALIGTVATGPKTPVPVIHAVMDRAGGVVLYCTPTKEILTPVDMGDTVAVTCNMCKEKLRSELA